ncbi:MAG: hypothetical protein WAL75_13750 [Terracidiphilus sp.]
MLRPLDLVVLLKLSLEEGRPPYLQLARDLYLYPSEVYSSVKRARASQLLQGPQLDDRLNRSAFLEFLLHGVRYAFPPVRGTLTRGVPTAYAAPPLSLSIAPGTDPPPVWPLSTGTVRGVSFSPLHKNAPRAALADSRLYELLALVDALRDGRARERVLAGSELTKRIGKDGRGASKS